ncbi:MAG: ribokinase [Alphaproteobacteria bacterium]|nr:ribokinase [Alphaproteobacteria bacterium]
MIVAFGSITIDLITPVPHLPARGETVLGRDYAVVPGGKGANQALAAARGAQSGQRVALVGTVGSDAWGEAALEHVRAAGVDVSSVARGRLRTACGFISVDPQGQTIITAAPGASMETRAAQLDGLVPRLRAGDWLILQMEVRLDENWRALRAAKAAGARTLLNLAPAMPVDAAVLGDLNMLVVNEHEARTLADLFGVPAVEHKDIARALASRFDLTCIVTLGAAGSIAVEATGATWSVGALPVAVVDTTGAGDAYVGYLTAALDCGSPLGEAMRFASAGASLSCEVTGAQTGYRARADVVARMVELAPTRS